MSATSALPLRNLFRWSKDVLTSVEGTTYSAFKLGSGEVVDIWEPQLRSLVCQDLREINPRARPLISWVPSVVGASAIGMMARTMASNLGLDTLPLHKCRPTFHYQATGDSLARRHASAGLFVVIERPPSPAQPVILLDDTAVSGAMLASATDALRRAGNDQITTYVIAQLHTEDCSWEFDLDCALYCQGGADAVCQVVRSEHYFFSGFLLTLLDSIPDSDARCIALALLEDSRQRAVATLNTCEADSPIRVERLYGLLNQNAWP